MANTPQAKKRIRRNTARTIVNKNRVSRIRTLVKKVESAVAAGDKAAAAAALQAAQPEMARGVAKGVLHKNTVARKYSRLTKSVNAIACFAPRRLFDFRSEEHTSELQSLMRTSYAVFCLNKKKLT